MIKDPKLDGAYEEAALLNEEQALKAQEPSKNKSSRTRFLEPEELKRELRELVEHDLLPNGFDLEAASRDPAFVRLVVELPAYAAVRVYDAELRAERAEQSAMEGILTRLRSRERLPMPSRADAAAPAKRDYLAMSPEDFAALEREYRAKARAGIKVKL